MAKEQALRYNTNKPQWSLVDFESLTPMVRVLEFGATKYTPNNWRKGIPVTKLCESLLRHVFELLDGKDIDEESKINIVGHIQCNAMFLAHTLKHHPEFDDRFKKENKEVEK
jgi:hypothetical protein